MFDPSPDVSQPHPLANGGRRAAGLPAAPGAEGNLSLDRDNEAKRLLHSASDSAPHSGSLDMGYPR